MKNQRTRNLVFASVFLALAFTLPFLTGQIKEIGDSLLPMHLPVMLCGMICGPWYGLTVGISTPLLRGAFFGMPPIYPNAIWMCLELGTYGLVLGLLYNKLKRKTTPFVILYTVCAMICGRIVWGIAKAVLMGLGNKTFTFYMFFVGGFADALPGIIIQLILIPVVINLWQRLERRYQL